jgi:hypothetical protein
MKRSGTQLIAAERSRQIRKLGWSHSHDSEHHVHGELAEMAAWLTCPSPAIQTYAGKQPLKLVHDLGWNITPHDRINELVKAGALIAAEIDRLVAQAKARAEYEASRG